MIRTGIPPSVLTENAVRSTVTPRVAASDFDIPRHRTPAAEEAQGVRSLLALDSGARGWGQESGEAQTMWRSSVSKRRTP